MVTPCECWWERCDLAGAQLVERHHLIAPELRRLCRRHITVADVHDHCLFCDRRAESSQLCRAHLSGRGPRLVPESPMPKPVEAAETSPRPRPQPEAVRARVLEVLAEGPSTRAQLNRTLALGIHTDMIGSALQHFKTRGQVELLENGVWKLTGAQSKAPEGIQTEPSEQPLLKELVESGVPVEGQRFALVKEGKVVANGTWGPVTAPPLPPTTDWETAEPGDVERSGGPPRSALETIDASGSYARAVADAQNLAQEGKAVVTQDFVDAAFKGAEEHRATLARFEHFRARLREVLDLPLGTEDELVTEAAAIRGGRDELRKVRDELLDKSSDRGRQLSDVQLALGIGGPLRNDLGDCVKRQTAALAAINKVAEVFGLDPVKRPTEDDIAALRRKAFDLVDQVAKADRKLLDCIHQGERAIEWANAQATRIEVLEADLRRAEVQREAAFEAAEVARLNGSKRFGRQVADELRKLQGGPLQALLAGSRVTIEFPPALLTAHVDGHAL